MDRVHAVRKILALGKSVFIADQGISFGFTGGIEAAGGLEIDLEGCAFFGSLDLCLAVVGVLDDSDIALDDAFRHISGGRVIEFDAVVFCFSADRINCGIEQISFGRSDLTDSPSLPQT